MGLNHVSSGSAATTLAGAGTSIDTFFSHNGAFSWLTLGENIFIILLSFVLAKLAIKILTRTVHKLLNSRTVRLEGRRRDTLASLLENVVRYVVYLVLIITVLSVIGINVAAILAGAGIIGLAIGFGAQSLIKDVLTGLFILFEDQYGVGDLVKINGVTGTVKSIGLRLTRLQGWTGEIEIIPNGQVQQITNYSRNNSLAVIDVGIAYENQIDKALNVMERVLNELKDVHPDIVGDIKVLGVQALREYDILLRATAECSPTKHVGVLREAQRRIKEAFDEAKITMVVYPSTIATTARQTPRT